MMTLASPQPPIGCSASETNQSSIPILGRFEMFLCDLDLRLDQLQVFFALLSQFLLQVNDALFVSAKPVLQRRMKCCKPFFQFGNIRRGLLLSFEQMRSMRKQLAHELIFQHTRKVR